MMLDCSHIIDTSVYYIYVYMYICIIYIYAHTHNHHFSLYSPPNLPRTPSLKGGDRTMARDVFGVSSPSSRDNQENQGNWIARI